MYFMSKQTNKTPEKQSTRKNLRPKADASGRINGIGALTRMLSNSTRKLLLFEIINMLIAFSKNKIKFIVLFIIIFGALSSLIQCHEKLVNVVKTDNN